MVVASEEARLFLAGGLAGCAAKTIVAPLERVRIAAQVAISAESRARSSFGIGAEIVRAEGIRGLWRSNGVAVLRTFPSKAVVFGGNDAYARFLRTLPGDWVPRGAVAPCAGGLAGLTAVAITYPLDVVRTRLAASSADGGSRGISATVSALLRERGLKAFYVGVRPTLFGGTFYEAARFGAFDRFRSAPALEDPRRPGQRVWYANLVAGSLAGVAAGLTMYPNDTIRRQLQMGRSTTYACAARTLYANGGVGRLYAGLAPYLLRAAPGAACQFAAFAELKRLLDVG